MYCVASILPFMAVLTDPELVQSNVMLNTLFIISQHIGIQTSEQFLLALGVLVFVLLIASLAFKALTTYAQARFVMMREYSVSKRLVESYLRQPYSWFLSRHSADLGKNILSEVATCIDSGLHPMLNLLAHSIVALVMLILLLIVDPLLALSIGVALGLAYAGIFSFMSGWLQSLGQTRIDANKERFTSLSEAFGATKEVKVYGLEQSTLSAMPEPLRLTPRAEQLGQ